MVLILALAVVVPFVAALVFTRILIAFAPRMGLVDVPSARKDHAKVTPLGGGIAIFGAVWLSLGGVLALAWFAGRHPELSAWMPELARVHARGVLSRSPLLALLFAASTVQMLLGLADDWRRTGLPYQVRLLIEVGLAVLLIRAGVVLSLFTDQFWITAPVTVLWIVGLVNAMNFLDNMDGLSAGVASWAALFFMAVAVLVGDLFVAGCFAILLGATEGFLRYNFAPARIFMGDAGSNFLGFWLGVLTVIGTFNTAEYSHVTILAPLCILAVPIYDSASVITLRLLQGKSPFHPDKQHFSHRLVELGFRPTSAVLVIYLVTVTTGLGGLLLFFVAPAASALVLLQVACSLGIIAILEFAAFRRPPIPRPREGKPRHDP